MSDEQIQEMVGEVHAEPHRAKHYAVMVLDRSGSMERIGVEAVGAVNSQLENTKKGVEDGLMEAEVSLVTFSSQVDTPEFWCTPIDEVQPLKEEDYTPRGFTAMYDAVGYAITELLKRADINEPDTTVLMIIISDGHENASRQYNAQGISNMVRELQDTSRWTFAYEGADQDLAAVQQSTNINTGNMLRFAANADGMGIATRSRRMASQAYYDSRSRAIETMQVDASAGAKELTSAQSISFYDDSAVINSNDSESFEGPRVQSGTSQTPENKGS
jgi:uncharacterized protein YegL